MVIDDYHQYGGADNQTELLIKVPGNLVGAGPNSIAVDAVNAIAYVALYSNAIAVVNLSTDQVQGLILNGQCAELGRAGRGGR